MDRIINIDWLEVFCIENADNPLTLSWLRETFEVDSRHYGTPQYKEVWIIKYNGFPYIEVRRNPYSVKSKGGIMPDGACHIRLSNRTCYFDNPAMVMVNFIEKYGLRYQSISRIDICCDFQTFDNGTRPAAFLKRYFADRYVKLHQYRFKTYSKEHPHFRKEHQSIDSLRPKVALGIDNQGEISAHGTDRWQGKVYNYCGWGSESSPISTKLYNKTMELNREGHIKTYIQDQWRGRLDRANGDVWRLEFSIKSEIKNFIHLETGDLLDNSLAYYSDRHSLLLTFQSLYEIYFDFRVVELDDSGNLKRKNRLKRVDLFHWQNDEVYKPMRPTIKKDPTRTDRILLRHLQSYVGMELDKFPCNDIQNAALKVMHLLERRINPPALSKQARMFLDRLDYMAHYYDSTDPYGAELSDACTKLMMHLETAYNIDANMQFNQFRTLDLKRLRKEFYQQAHPEYHYPCEDEEAPDSLLPGSK